MAVLQSITNNTWGISTYGYGTIVEGINLIRQSIGIILRTSKGSDPLRPLFGSDVSTFIDHPMHIAIPNIKSAIVQALDIWEPRIKVIKITHEINPPDNISFTISYAITDESITDKIIFDFKNGNKPISEKGEVVVQAFLPINPNNDRYLLSFQTNGKDAYPLPDSSGFNTVEELYSWILGNWFFYGTWHLLSDKLIGRIESATITSAALKIWTSQIKKITAVFPELSTGESFSLSLEVDGVKAAPNMPHLYTTPGEVLSFIQSNWSNYGTWTIEAAQANSTAGFSNEFADEFEVSTDYYKLSLITTSEKDVQLKIQTYNG